jgi:hypothetical protein
MADVVVYVAVDACGGFVCGFFYGEGGEFFGVVLVLRWEGGFFEVVICVVSISELAGFAVDTVHLELPTDVLFTYQHVILEYTAARWLANLVSLTDTILHTVFPLAFIPAAISPVHLPIAMPHIIEIGTVIAIATRPSENPLPILPIIKIMPFIPIPLLYPHPHPMPQPILKIPLIIRLIPRPGILAHSLRPPIHIPTHIPIPIPKRLRSTPMLQPTPHLPLIPRLRRHYHSQPIRLIRLPLTHISLVLRGPAPTAVFHPSQELTLVDFVVVPVEGAAALRLVIHEGTEVQAVGEELEAVPVLVVVLEVALVETAGAVEDQAVALDQVVGDAAD